MEKLEKIIENIGIEEKDKNIVTETFQLYSSLRDNNYDYSKKKLEQKNSPPRFKEYFKGEYSFLRSYKTGYKLKDFKYVGIPEENFAKIYGELYNHPVLEKDKEKRTLFLEVTKKVIELVKESRSPIERNSINSGSSCYIHIWRNILKSSADHPEKALSNHSISLWSKSFKHLKKHAREKLGRFLRISNEYLSDFHPSYDYIFESIAKKGEIFNIEDFIFDLSREQNLTKDEVSEAFSVLKSIRPNFRKDIEEVRKRVPKEKTEEMNKCLYNLLLHSKKTNSSIKDLVSIFREISYRYRERNYGLHILNNESKLIKIMENDSYAMERFKNNVRKILEIEIKSGTKGLFNIYTSLTEHISEIKDKQYSEFYTSLSYELIEEEVRLKNKKINLEEVLRKFERILLFTKELDSSSKETLISLMDKGIKKLKHNIPLEELIKHSIISILVDKEKARYFIGGIIN